MNTIPRIFSSINCKSLTLAFTLFASPLASNGQPAWDIVGQWEIENGVQGGQADLSFTVTNENFQTGVFNAWDNNFRDAFSGTVSGSNINFTDYQYGEDSFGNPLLNVLSIEGSIATNGTMSGPMDQSNGGTDWHGTFSTITGQAVPCSGPIFSVQPVSLVINAGQAAAFTAAAMGDPAVTYQWQFDGTNIPDSTNSTYSLSSTAVTNLGTYDVVASNAIGTNVSAAASLSFLDIKCVPTLILSGPIGQPYNIERASILGGLTNWTLVTNITLGTNQPFIYADFSSFTNSGAVLIAVPQPQ